MSDITRDSSCLFCRIIAGEIPAQKLYENGSVIVIADINPQSPTHVLAIPLRHITSIAQVTLDDAQLLAELFTAVNIVARERGIEESGYRLVINHGEDAGQSVPHLHVHVLGGKPLGWPPFSEG
jgi:histidine triad (HIT) family protein